MKHLRHLYLVVAALILALAVWQFAKVNIGNGIMLVLLTGVPVFFWFISPINLLAFWYISQRKKRLAINMLSEAKKADEHNMMKEQFKMVEMGLKRI